MAVIGGEPVERGVGNWLVGKRIGDELTTDCLGLFIVGRSLFPLSVVDWWPNHYPLIPEVIARRRTMLRSAREFNRFEVCEEV